MALGEYLGAGSSVTKGLFRLNGNANDSSGNSNNGTATNITWVDGRLGNQSASFNGSSSKITYTLATNSGSAYTINIWSNTPTGKVLWSAQSGIYEDYLSTVTFHTTSNGGNSDGVRDLNFTYPGTGWHLYTISISSGANFIKKVYIDGIQVATSTSSYTHSGWTGPHILGKYYEENTYNNGLIDEVIIENRTWTTTEIKKYYTYSQGKFAIL